MENIEDLTLKYKLSEENSEDIYQRIYRSVTFLKRGNIGNCNLIIGQQGSGKSSFSYKLEESNNNIAIINGDFIRSFHPAIKELLNKYPNEYCYITYPDWQNWKARLLNDLIKDGYELNLEASCSDIENIKEKVEELKKKQYNIKLYVLAVSSIESRLRTLERFCNQTLENGIGRVSNYERHQTSFNNIKEMLTTIDLEYIKNIYFVDNNFILYPISNVFQQRELLLNLIRMSKFSLTITYESFSKRIIAIDQFLSLYQDRISSSLNDRVNKQIVKLKKDFSGRGNDINK